MFIDETGASTKMARMRGRAKRGERCRAPIPHGHWRTTTFTGGLRLSGMTAPMVLDGPMDGPAFQAYVEQVLVPTLQPGDLVVMDNLPPHKPPAIRLAIEGAGASLRYLPPYSPDFNRSRTPSPSSRRCSGKRLHEHATTFGTPSETRCPKSPQPNAKTTSPPQATSRNERILL